MSLNLTEKQLDSFWKHVVKTEKCWYWIGRQNNTGYGMFYNCEEAYAHRISDFG